DGGGGEQGGGARGRGRGGAGGVLRGAERVSSLDLRLGREVVQLISRLCRERGTTLLVSLHTLELLSLGFDRVLALRGGRLVWQGRPQQLTRALLRDVYGAEYQALRLDDVPLEGAPR